MAAPILHAPVPLQRPRKAALDAAELARGAWAPSLALASRPRSVPSCPNRMPDMIACQGVNATQCRAIPDMLLQISRRRGCAAKEERMRDE